MRKSTIIRTILFFIVVINYILKATHHEVIHIEENTIIETIDMIISVLILILSWWKNNSFSKNAQKADEYLQKLKKLEQEEIEKNEYYGRFY